MEITEELYTWLNDHQILPDDVASAQGMRQLDDVSSAAFENGTNFAPLVKRLYQLQQQSERLVTPMPEINSMKKVNSPSARLYNWNAVTQALAMFDIEVDQDTKSLIIAGDRDMVIDVLKQIQAKEQEYLTRKPSAPSSVASGSGKQTQIGPDGSLLIDSLDTAKALSDTEACLEFLLVSFCKNFDLTPKQSAGLLTQSNKYLAHIIAKGIKGKFEKIVAWYQDIHSCVKHLVSLIIKEEANDSLNLILTAFRPGFFSRSVEVAQWCCRVFTKLGQEFGENEMVPQAWDWFTKDFGGVDACILSIQKFGPEIRSMVVSVFTQFARNNFLELFSLHIRNAFPEPAQYLMIINDFLSNLSEIRTAKQEIVDAGVIGYWLDFGLREADSGSVKRNLGTRQAAISLLIELWIHFPAKIEEQEEIANSILTCLKRGIREKSKMLCFSCVASLFHLLEVFSNERNQYAPIVYKMLTFSVVENYVNSELREFLMRNFINAFDKVSSIPVGVLVEPLIKQIQLAQDDRALFNTFDFDLYSSAARHPRLTPKNAIQLVDMLGKVYMYDPIFSRASGIPFMLVVARFLENENMQEYVLRFTKFGLREILTNEKQKKPTPKHQPRYNNQPVGRAPTQEELAAVEQQRRQRDNVLDMMCRIIKLENEVVNEQIREQLVRAHREARKIVGGADYKPIVIVLALLGDAQELIAEHEKVQAEQSPTPKTRQPRELNQSVNTTSKQELVRASRPQYRTPPPPNQRVVDDIDRIKMRRMQRENSRVMENEVRQKQFEKQKRVLRHQLEKRKVQLGVVSRSRDELIFNDTGASDESSEIQLRELEKETPEDRETVNIVLKRYALVLKMLFKKYSGTGYSSTKPTDGSFDTLAQRHKLMIESEFYKMMKEHGVTPAMIKVEEFHTLMKLYNQKQGVSDLGSVDFLRFQGLFAQTAIFVFGKSPMDLGNLPPGFAVKALILFFRKSVVEAGQTTQIYDLSDPGVGDRRQAYDLNQELREDPDHPLPQGWRRVQERDIDVDYRIPSELGLPPNVSMVVELLDEALSAKLGFHLIEPQVRIESYYIARGIKTAPETQGTIKRYLSSQNTEVGELPASTSPLPPTKPGNKAVKLKHQEEQISAINEEEKEVKRRLRKIELEEKLRVQREEKKHIEEEKQRKIAAENEEKQRAAKRKETLMEIEREKKAKQVAEWKKKREAEQKSKEEEEKNRKQQKMRNSQSFIKEQKRKIAQASAEAKIKRDRENADAERKARLEEKKREKLRKQQEETLQKSRAQRDQDAQQREAMKTLYNSGGVQAVYNQHARLIDTLYRFYGSMAGYQMDHEVPPEDGTLQFPGFNKFTSQFNIWPGLMPNEEVIAVFRNFTKEKQTAVLSPDNFKEALLHLAVSGEEKINVFLGKGPVASGVSGMQPDVLEGLFRWMDISDNPNDALNKLKNMKSDHPQKKKKEAEARASNL